MNSELIAKAKEAKSAEELLAMAKESGVPHHRGAGKGVL